MKKFRIAIATAYFVIVTLLFLDFTGTLHPWFGWAVDIQFIPAVMAASAAALIVLALLTLLFGRIYCSVICPLGVMQDAVSGISGRRRGRKNRFRYAPAKSWLRYGIMALFTASILTGTGTLVSLLDPYAAYGRIASNLFAPVFRLGNNLLNWFAEIANSYAFYPTEVALKSVLALSVAFATFGLIVVLAWRGGRTYCNTFCPVGAFLGLVSRFSLFRPTFAPDKCTGCGLCEKGCKSSCIDSKNMRVDLSRCVSCFNCLNQCKFGAMTYAPRWKRLTGEGYAKADTGKPASESGSVETVRLAASCPAKRVELSRRGMLPLLAFAAVAATGRTVLAATARNTRTQAGNSTGAPLLHVDGGLADIADKEAPQRQTPLVPPGAASLGNLNLRCTACHLCISACPNAVLHPSTRLSSLMQPEMSFEGGWCRPECTECSRVCPAGAICKISTAEKTAISIGHAVWVKENCLSYKGEVQCNSCERHCPTKAITLVAREQSENKSPKIPVVDNERCIGCGACEYHCPVRPFSAMYVEGNVRHHSV